VLITVLGVSALKLLEVPNGIVGALLIAVGVAAAVRLTQKAASGRRSPSTTRAIAVSTRKGR
jgi:predicted RND superfamily exporter protein